MIKDITVQQLTIRIDTKNGRIHIHNSVLKELGAPDFVFIGYERKTDRLLILAAAPNERGALRLRFDKDHSCYIHSKGLIDGIRKASGMLSELRSYQLTGILIENELAIAFPIEGALLTEGAISCRN